MVAQQQMESLLHQLQTFTASRDHQSEVTEVTRRIKELLEEIDPDPELPQFEEHDEEEMGLPSRPAPGPEHHSNKEGSHDQSSSAVSPGFDEDIEEVSQGISDSDSACYTREDPNTVSQVAQQKLNMLIGRLNTVEREEVLKDVGIWLHARVGIARRELTTLGRLDRECDVRGFERESVAHSVVDALRSHEHDTAGAIRHFCQELGGVHDAFQGAKDKQNDDDDNETAHLGAEELEALIDAAQEQLATKEVEAWHLLRELECSEIGLTVQDDGKAPGEGRGDLLIELEKQAVYQRETLRQTEQRAGSIKAAVDHLVGQSAHGADFESFVSLSAEDSATLEELRQEMAESLLPGLLEERERDYGDKLRPPDETYHNALRRECELLHQRIDSTQEIIEQLNGDDYSAVEEEIECQLRCIDEDGTRPRNSSLHRCVDTLDSSAWSEFISDTSQNGEKRFRYLMDLESAVRKNVQADLVRATRLHETLLEASHQDRILASKVKVQNEQEQILKGTLDSLEDHRALFAAAAKMTSKESGGAPHERAGHKGEKTGSGSAAAVAAATAVVSGPSSARLIWEQEEWAKPFHPDEDNSYSSKALAVQADILNALRSEERRLRAEADMLEGNVDARTNQLGELCRLGITGLDKEMLERLKEAQSANKEAVQNFAKSLQSLSEVTTTEAMAKTERLSERHIAIERVRIEQRKIDVIGALQHGADNQATDFKMSTDSKMSNSEGGQDQVLHDTLRQQVANQKLAQRVLKLIPEVEALKRKYAARSRQNRESHNAKECRSARRTTRALSTTRAEICATTLQRTRELAADAANMGRSRSDKSQKKPSRRAMDASSMSPTPSSAVDALAFDEVELASALGQAEDEDGEELDQATTMLEQLRRMTTAPGFKRQVTTESDDLYVQQAHATRQDLAPYSESDEDIDIDDDDDDDNDD